MTPRQELELKQSTIRRKRLSELTALETLRHRRARSEMDTLTAEFQANETRWQAHGNHRDGTAANRNPHRG